ncbi:hemerythrin domain-containing protein [Thermoactinospora rubra]|uniref:hemerythrin domain-containing protein n=1 Tax=Thermoactinospora rubra TaxID=1088767 RepID=UPI000A11C84A|nr:hemerythrin domain-containing protein [Thermoactinospora rubra]
MTNSRLDMTMMFAVHDALRRELTHLARITSRTGDDPRRLLAAAVGWELFKGYLHVHHTSEDDKLWPAMRRAVAGRPDDLALLDAMEAEHAVIDPLLAAIDAAVADADSGHERLGGLVDQLTTDLTGHLKHEETDALPLIGATLGEREWTEFGQEHSRRVGPDARGYLPWVLDGMDEERRAAILGRFPEHLRETYARDWRPAFEQISRWG